MANEILKTLLPFGGWTEERIQDLTLTGGFDPILPTSFRIGGTAAAALSAVGFAVSDLWETKTGRRQQVAVDARRATASLRSGKYMQMEGANVSTERNNVM